MSGGIVRGGCLGQSRVGEIFPYRGWGGMFDRPLVGYVATVARVYGLGFRIVLREGILRRGGAFVQ